MILDVKFIFCLIILKKTGAGALFMKKETNGNFIQNKLSTIL